MSDNEKDPIERLLAKSDLSAKGRLLVMIVDRYTYTDDEKEELFFEASYLEFSSLMNVTVPTFHRALNETIQKGFVKVLNRTTNGGLRIKNQYIIQKETPNIST